MTTNEPYLVGRNVLYALGVVLRAAMGASTELNVTGVDLPPHIRRSQVGGTTWAPTREVAQWLRDELRKVPAAPAGQQ